MAFGDEFDIDIPDEDTGQMRRVKDAIAYIESHGTSQKSQQARTRRSSLSQLWCDQSTHFRSTTEVEL